jgi:serine/threonine-protein kinase
MEAPNGRSGYAAGRAMTCPRCRTPNADAAFACRQCGAALGPLGPGAVVGERYLVLEPIGAGGMGVVYKARDRVLEDVVALKVLRPEVAATEEIARRFRSEIRLARRVTHRNVCRIHEYGEHGGLRYISMAYVDGVDLKRTLRERGALPPAEAFGVAGQIALGLEAIHDEGIVHRDLKAANVMIDGRGGVRLMDFGIAKNAEGGMTPTITSTGMIVGTPEYMSPEQGRGDKVDRRSDLYSLGVVLFEMFTGGVPFKGETPIDTIIKHMQEPLPLDGPAARGLPPALVPVLRRALAKAPADRFATAAEMAEALAVARQATLAAPGAGGPAPVAAVPGARKTGLGRASWPWAAALGAAVAAGAGLALWPTAATGPEPRPDAPPASARAVPSPGAARPASAPSRTPALAPSPTPRATATAVAAAPPAPAVPLASPRDVPAHTPPSPAARGFLQVVVVPWAEVYVDGRRMATAPLRTIPLAAGAHVVRLVHPDFQPLQRRIVIVPGRTLSLSVDLPEEGVRRRRP